MTLSPLFSYLSPACVGSVVLLAVAKGDTAEFWRWEDGEDDDKKEEKKEEEKVDEKKSSAKSSAVTASTKDQVEDEDWTSGGLSESGKSGMRLTSQGNKKKK